MVIDNRVARGRPDERGLGDRTAGKGIEQRRFADPRAPHQHDHQQRIVCFQVVGFAAQILDQDFQSLPAVGWKGLHMHLDKPGVHLRLQPAQVARQRAAAAVVMMHFRP